MKEVVKRMAQVNATKNGILEKKNDKASVALRNCRIGRGQEKGV